MFMRILAAFVLAFALNASAADFVVVCPIEDMVDDGLSVLVERAVKEAEGAKAIIFEIDTPGGVVDSAIKITQSILGAPCRTIAYIKGMGAISAGALISFSCKDIVMAPDTNIGAATPVVASAEGMMPTGEKEVSFMRARMRAMAERNGHNPAIAEAMVDKDIALYSYRDADGKLQVVGTYPEGKIATDDTAKIDPLEPLRRFIEPQMPQPPAPPEKAEPPAAAATASAVPQAGTAPEGAELVLPSGKLLTLTPQEALKFGVIPTTVNSLDELLGFYGLAGVEIRRITPTWGERVFRWLTNPAVAGLLLLFGIGGIYLELKTPGFGLPGIVGITCLALFFGAHWIIGLAEIVDILLVAIGVILIAAELFLIPGFGIIGAAGILCVVAGLYLALTNVPIPQYSWDYDRLQDALSSLMTAFLLLGLFIYFTWKLFPRLPVYGRIILTHSQQPAAGYVVQPAEESAAVGWEGTATSMLRPSGRGRFSEETLQVVTRGEFLPPGTRIRIVQVDGNRFVVEQVEEKS